VPHNDGDAFDLERQNQWLTATHGRRLEPVYAAATARDSYPPDTWIALLGRGPGLTHAVIAEGGRIVHDPACSNGGCGNLWPGDLAYANDRSLPLGFVMR
jgi:hypothetical protein